jgi:hypothetical protein
MYLYNRLSWLILWLSGRYGIECRTDQAATPVPAAGPCY